MRARAVTSNSQSEIHQISARRTAIIKIPETGKDIITRTELEAALLQRQMQAALRNVEKDESRRLSPVVTQVTPRGVVQGII